MSTYLFIDGGYLRKRFTDFTKRFYGVECMPDLAGMEDALAGKHLPRPFDKAFYYDCFAEQAIDPAPDSLPALRRNDESFVSAIRAMPRWHVQEGRLVGGRKAERGQKRVDVLLTVEMLSHAFAKNMTTAILVAGDDDFTPLVNELVRHGIYVEVWSDPQAAAKHLGDSADEFCEIKTWFHWRLMPAPIRAKHQLPDFGASFLIPLTEFRVLKSGTAKNGSRIMIGEAQNQFHFAGLENSSARSHVRSPERKLIEELIEYEFRHHPLFPLKWESGA